MIKLHKRQCVAKVIHRGEENDFGLMVMDDRLKGSGGFMAIPAWELVSIWYQIGELLGFDREDARLELERLHWRHDQGELDEPTQKIVGRKHKKRVVTETRTVSVQKVWTEIFN